MIVLSISFTRSLSQFVSVCVCSLLVFYMSLVGAFKSHWLFVSQIMATVQQDFRNGLFSNRPLLWEERVDGLISRHTHTHFNGECVDYLYSQTDRRTRVSDSVNFSRLKSSCLMSFDD